MTSVKAPLLRGEAVCWGACAQSLLGSQGRPRGELDPLWQQAGVRAAGRVLGLSVGPLTRTELRDTGGEGGVQGWGPRGGDQLSRGQLPAPGHRCRCGICGPAVVSR